VFCKVRAVREGSRISHESDVWKKANVAYEKNRAVKVKRAVRLSVLDGNTNIHYTNPVCTQQRAENSYYLQHDNALMMGACRMSRICAMASHKCSYETVFVRNIRYFQRRLTSTTIQASVASHRARVGDVWITVRPSYSRGLGFLDPREQKKKTRE
jgi:hypothetical protein